MSSSEHSLLLQLALVPVVVADEAAVADAGVAEQRGLELQQHRQVEQYHRQERRQQMRAADVEAVVDAEVVVAVMPFPRFVDPRHNRGFHSRPGPRPSTTTTRQMP